MRELTVIGRLTHDPNMFTASSGTAVTNFSIATNSKRGGVNVVDYTRCSAFNQQAGYINQNARKGDEVFVRGTYSVRSWKDTDGVERSREELTVSDFRVLRRPEATTESVDLTDAIPPQ